MRRVQIPDLDPAIPTNGRAGEDDSLRLDGAVPAERRAVFHAAPAANRASHNASTDAELATAHLQALLVDYVFNIKRAKTSVDLVAHQVDACQFIEAGERVIERRALRLRNRVEPAVAMHTRDQPSEIFVERQPQAVGR